ncbi:MAG TPA: helix-turn-helix domain-containing protein [Caulobacteraceae bacterium]|nr:helix-turn-helix domain-containing protein [Caulobacteraceae bacterium]
MIAEHTQAEGPIGALSPAEFCRAYGIKTTKFYELLKTGELRARKCGRRTLIARVDAAAWWASLPEIVR